MLLGTIRTYIAEHGRSPTLRELEAVTGLSLPTLQCYIKRLQAEGLILYQGYKFRGLKMR